MITNHAKGLAAEARAERWLLAQGLKLVARRYKCNAGEIDLIVSDGRSLIFAEVKARETLTQALEAVTPRAQQRIRSAALSFQAAESKLAAAMPGMRFDVIAVLPGDRIERIENAF